MLDELDRSILSLLQKDGRMANKEVAQQVGLVPSATSERLRIRSIEARLDPQKVDFSLLAFVFVRTNEMVSGCRTGEELARIPEVQEAYNIAGEDCYLIKVRTRDAESLSLILREKVGQIESVVSTRTTIVLETCKETCALPVTPGTGNGSGDAA